MYWKTFLIFFFSLWMGSEALAQSRCVGVHHLPMFGAGSRRSSAADVFLDTNLINVLVEVSLSVPRDGARTAMFESLARHFETTTPQFFARQDIFDRIGMVGTIRREVEVMDAGVLSGRFPVFRHAPKPETLRILEEANIGGGRGRGDRNIIAELLALSGTRDTPIYFVTGDRKVINGLCRFSPACVDPKYHVQRFRETGFEIEINGDRLTVLPIFTN